MAANDSGLRNAAQEEDARSDLAALIAASRELGPDMDRALVDSYLNRHREAIAKQQAPAPAPAPARGAITHQTIIAGIVMAGAFAAYCIALWKTNGAMFWLIFPLMGWLGGWGFWGAEGKSERRAARRDYHQQRWELRQEYRARRRVSCMRPWEWNEQERDDEPTDTAPRNDAGQPPTVHV